MASTKARPWINAGLAVISFGAIAVFVALDFLMNTQVPMQEVGSTPEYSHLVGQTFRTREDLRIFGITADRHYARQVDYYVLVGRPGFEGREIVTRPRQPANRIIAWLMRRRCQQQWQQRQALATLSCSAVSNRERE
jgi:hypothetical protein